MPEAVIVPFMMQGARDAVAAGLSHVERQVTSLEHAVVDNPGLAFDLAKTLVESVCQSVLKDRRFPYNEDDDLPKLFRAVSQCVPFLPVSAANQSEIRASLERTMNGLKTAIQGLCELRNQCGFASHGSAESRPAMESVQALLAAQAADTIVGFLYRVHIQDRTLPRSPKALYEANSKFNESVDDIYGMIRIFEVEFRPSAILFQMEPESYRVYLADFDPAGSEAGAAAAPDRSEESAL